MLVKIHLALILLASYLNDIVDYKNDRPINKKTGNEISCVIPVILLGIHVKLMKLQNLYKI